MPQEVTKDELVDIIKKDGAWLHYRPVGGIGDAVMLCPAITGTKKQYPKDINVLICVDYIKSVFQHHPYVDYILSYTEAQLNEQEDIHDLAELSAAGGIVLRYQHPCPAAVYEAQANPWIVKTRQEIFCDVPGVKFDINNYCIELDEESEHAAELLNLDYNYVVVQLRSHGSWRDYKWNDWLLTELVHLGKKLDFQVVTIDANVVPKVKGIYPLVQTPMSLVLGVVKHANLVIGPDSSMVHVAGAFGTPTYALFGPTNPRVRLLYSNANWLPRYKKCNRQYCWYKPCYMRFCLAVRPKSIVRQVRAILNGGA